jgi:NADPH-dependent 2,4-dienoyl-CoA reductase/sulfur reductase-like enzyme
MSAFLEKYYTNKGVRLIAGASVIGFEGRDNHVTRVLLGVEDPIQADIVVAGIGVTPVTDIAEDTGILVKHGIVVDEYLASNVKDVYAVGDVAEYYDVIFDKRRCIEHWDNAVTQGQCAMQSMMGTPHAFVHVPYFFSDIFDLSFEFWGDTTGADDIVYRGDTASGSFSVWWLKEQVLVAAFLMSRPDEERESVAEWIECLQKLSADDLRDTSQPISKAVVAELEAERSK